MAKETQYYSWKKTNFSFKLNTKGFCFLCVNVIGQQQQQSDEDNDDDIVIVEEKINNKTISLQCLKRHLKINLDEIGVPVPNPRRKNDDDERLPSLEEEEGEIQVDLCQSCRNLIKKFSALLQKLEMIQMDVNFCLKRINETIPDKSKHHPNRERLRDYTELMTEDIDALGEFAFVEKLRKAIQMKTLNMTSGAHLLVAMDKLRRRVPVRLGKSSECDSTNANANVYPTASTSAATAAAQTTSQSFLSTIITLSELPEPEAALNNDADVWIKKEIKILHESNSENGDEEDNDDDDDDKDDAADDDHANYDYDPTFSRPSSPSSSEEEGEDDNDEDYSAAPSSKAAAENTAAVGKYNTRFRSKSVSLPQPLPLPKEKPLKNTSKTSKRALKQTSTKKKTSTKMKTKTTKTGNWICSICQRKFSTKPSMNRHKKIIHSDERNYKCPEPNCGKSFKTASCLQGHQLGIHREKDFECEICKIATYASPSRFKQHQKVCRDTLEERLNRLKDRNKYKYPCAICPKTFAKEFQILRHTKNYHMKMKELSCDLCDKKYASIKGLNNHKDLIHLGKLFRCKICGNKRFEFKRELTRHEKICFLRKQQIKQPRLLRPSKKPEIRPSCPICKRTFSSRARMNWHKKIVHTDERKHKCEERGCGKAFKSLAVLNGHLISIHREADFKCRICNINTYTSHSRFKQHMKVCRDTLPKRLDKLKDPKFKFPCTICGKKFTKKFDALRHARQVHMNVRPHQCDLCENRYTTIRGLKNHKDSVHLGKRFRCKLCAFRFMCKRSLNIHFKKCMEKKRKRIMSFS